MWHDHQLHHEERSRAGEGQQARTHQQSLANSYLSAGYAGRTGRNSAQLYQWNIQRMQKQRDDEESSGVLRESISMKPIAQENIVELVKLGHERAAELKASCGAVDVRSLAQLISDLATQLEVQLARGNALAEENAGLNVFIEEECFVYSSDTPEPIDANDCKPETKVTDAFLAEVRAQGVDAAIEHLNKKFAGTGHIGVPVMSLEWLAQELRKGAAL